MVRCRRYGIPARLTAIGRAAGLHTVLRKNVSFASLRYAPFVSLRFAIGSLHSFSSLTYFLQPGAAHPIAGHATAAGAVSVP